MSKKLVDRLQNVALVVLTLSAVFLLLSFFHLRGGWTARFQTLLAVRPAAGGQEEASGVGELLAAPHIMVTSDSEYGRCGRLYTPAGDALLEKMLPLFGEALGSADQVGAAADQTLRAGLGKSSLYLDLTVELPLEVVAAWLGERTVFDRAVRAMALTTEGRDTAVLYLCGGEGEIFRYFTALPASAVEALTESVSPNGSLFAYETNYAPLAPYTVLVREAEGLPQVRSELPATYSSYRLGAGGPARRRTPGRGPHRRRGRLAAVPAPPGGAGGRLPGGLPVPGGGGAGALPRRGRRPDRPGPGSRDRGVHLPVPHLRAGGGGVGPPAPHHGRGHRLPVPGGGALPGLRGQRLRAAPRGLAGIDRAVPDTI